jgi:pimeloyl-ACP methyl ester carboxylesterase
MSRVVLPVVVIVAASAIGALIALAFAPDHRQSVTSLAPSQVASNPGPNPARPKKPAACVEGQRCWNWALMGDRTRPIFDPALRPRRVGRCEFAYRREHGLLRKFKRMRGDWLALGVCGQMPLSLDKARHRDGL